MIVSRQEEVLEMEGCEKEVWGREIKENYDIILAVSMYKNT